VFVPHGNIPVSIKQVDLANRISRDATLRRQSTYQIAGTQFIFPPTADLDCGH
jgi:hypothetical protein